MGEGFHEFQLNGKQLVFLFMAATVVAVAIFLSGVLVGRGARASKPSESIAAASPEAGVDPTAGTQRSPAPAAAATEGSSAASQETLTYPDRLEDPTPPPETLKETAESRPSSSSARAPVKPAPQQVPPRELRPQTPPPAPLPRTQTSAPSPARGTAAAPSRETAAAPEPKRTEPVASEPAGKGFVVQVAAVRERREAETIAKRLASKGYPSFVTTAAGAAHVFRVRVGKYNDRHQAEAVKARLEKEEQFKPWITR